MQETIQKTEKLDCTELNLKTSIAVYFKPVTEDTAKATVQFLDKQQLKQLVSLKNYDVELHRANKTYITIVARKYK